MLQAYFYDNNQTRHGGLEIEMPGWLDQLVDDKTTQPEPPTPAQTTPPSRLNDSAPRQTGILGKLGKFFGKNVD